MSTTPYVSEPPAAAADHANLATASPAIPASDGAADVCCDLTCTPSDAVAERVAAFPLAAKEATTPLSPASVCGRIAGIDPPPPRVIAS